MSHTRVSCRYHLRRLVSKTFPDGWNCDNHDRTNGSDYARIEDDRVFVCLPLLFEEAIRNILQIVKKMYEIAVC